MTAPTAPMFCARHQKVETGLACGRCETPICPKCMVMTDVGARCPTCAPRRKMPQLEIGPLYLLRGAAAAVVAGGALGGLWALLLPGSYGFFTIFLGIGLGYGIAEAVSLATNRKFGPTLQTAAAVGVVLAYVARNLLIDEAILPADDLVGYIAVVAGIAVAVNRLRF